ncbi:MAG: hypothetical protein ABSB91_03260 [Sedimentisphaerales bacterium]
MTVSAIGQNMSMFSLYGMQKPSASDIVSKIFEKLDTNGDGSLSADEISKAGKRAKNILGADANGDGIVTQDELLSDITKKMNNGMTPLMGMMQPPSADDIAGKIIDNLDTNGDGVLSTDEINNGGDLAQRILKADSNGDGVVTKDELVADIEKHMASRQAHGHHHSLGDIAGKIMDELDTDGNGELSTDEINNGGDSAKAIQPADTNGDGVVTMTELIAYLSQTTVGSQTSQSQLNSLA